MTLPSTPALDADNWIAVVKDAELDGIHNSPLETEIYVLLPWDLIKVWFILRIDEWIDTAVQMRILDDQLAR